MRRSKDPCKLADKDKERYPELADQSRGREPQVTELLKRFQQVEIPPHQAHTLGLSKDWKKSVTEGFAKVVLESALKHKDALRELEKY